MFFVRTIAMGASDFIMPDLMKCGGITGWLRIAGQAEAASIPMSSQGAAPSPRTSDPKNAASPNEKIPPSDATNQ